jgi:hypothetical protein
MRATVALTLAFVVFGCGEKTKPSPNNIHPGSASKTNGSATGSQGCKDPMTDDQTYRETTNPTLSNHQVGISNIFERDLPDKSGTVASRLSAILVIFDPNTKQTRRETVIAESEVTIGGDRYCIVKLEEGKSSPGSVTFRKLR